MTTRYKTPSWYGLRKIAPDLWAIDEKTWDRAYLAVGTRRALLVDTTWGMADLSAAVRSLTGLPVTVVLTHGHCDHVCGCRYFGTVRVSRGDLGLLRSSYTKSSAGKFSRNFYDCLAGNGISPSAWAQSAPEKIVTMSGGQLFDVGGMEFRVIPMPGHTRGSVCFYEEKKGYLFTGDSVLEGDILMNTADSADLGTYLESLIRLREMTPGARLVLPAHNRTPLDPSIIGRLIRGTGKILSGELRGRKTGKRGGVSVAIGRSNLICR